MRTEPACRHCGQIKSEHMNVTLRCTLGSPEYFEPMPDESRAELRRYDLKFFTNGSEGYSDIVIMEGGDYVKFEDAEAVAQDNEALRARIRKLESDLEAAQERLTSEWGLKASLIRAYTAGAQRGHESTVEGTFVPVANSDYATYFEDQIDDMLADGSFQELHISSAAPQETKFGFTRAEVRAAIGELNDAREKLARIYEMTEGYADGAEDATAHDRLCNEISAVAKA